MLRNSLTFLAAVALLAAGASGSSSFARQLQDCGQTCGTNNGGCRYGSKCNLNDVHCIYCSDCPGGFTGDRCEIPHTYGICANNGAADPLGPCMNESFCLTNGEDQIYCARCPTGYSGYRCEIPPSGATSSPTKIKGQVCGTNNGADSDGGACQNGSKCSLTPEGYVYCTNCPPGYSGYRCETKPAGATSAPSKIKGQVCGTNNGADSDGGACQNGSTCTLTPEGYVYCKDCPAGFSGYRCETKPSGTTAAPVKIPGQVCGTNNGADSDGGPCMNGSTCTLNPEGYVFCKDCPTGGTCKSLCGRQYKYSSHTGFSPAYGSAPEYGATTCCTDSQICLEYAVSDMNVIDSCLTKFACPANQPQCGRGLQGYYQPDNVFNKNDNTCCNSPCPPGAPLPCTSCILYGQFGFSPSFESQCAYNFTCAERNPCQHGGVCNNRTIADADPNGPSKSFASCTCTAGYSGTFCETGR